MKFCGCLETCFERGDNQWGHFGGVMCKNLGEGPLHQDYCKLNCAEIKPYFSQKEYDKLKETNNEN